jgi:hypothetical protein
VLQLKDRGWRYYYATDYSSFEKHFTKLVMVNIEFVVYRHFLKKVLSKDNIEFLFNILSGPNKLRTRAGHKATVMARRMSGEMCTSLGNTLTNFILCAYVMHTKGIGLQGFDGLFEGDDGLIGSNVELSSEDFRSCGFDIKLSRVPNPCTSSFCGLIFPPSGQTIRDPLRFFQKFGWTSSCIHAGSRVMHELLRAKSLSALYETPNCPIISAAARRCLHVTHGHRARFIHDGYHKVDITPGDFVIEPIRDDTRVLFEQQFGIPVSVQVEAERLILQGRWEILSDLITMSSRHTKYEPLRRIGAQHVSEYSRKYIFGE